MECYEQRIRLLPEMFDGRLTRELVDLLYYKMRSLGVSKAYMARYFGMSAYILSSLLAGRRTRCAGMLRTRLFPFLKGEHDFYIRNRRRSDSCVVAPVPSGMMQCMSRISRIYERCSRSAETKRRFIEKMDAAAFSAMVELIPEDAARLSELSCGVSSVKKKCGKLSVQVAGSDGFEDSNP